MAKVLPLMLIVACRGYAARINVDYPDLTREFI
jgi:hypothetical protein